VAAAGWGGDAVAADEESRHKVTCAGPLRTETTTKLEKTRRRGWSVRVASRQ
jgi:hypothetical protein